MFITLKMLLRTLLLPPAGPLLLAGAGLWLLARRRAGAVAARAGWLLVIAGLAGLWVLATPVMADALMRLAERYPALDLTRPPDAGAIVILGGGGARVMAPEYGGPAADFELLERVSYGAYVARRTALPVLVSGSAREALAMQTVLWRDFGIRTRWVDSASRDTFDDAQLSARLLKADGVRRVVLVTSSSHEWRAAHEFASAGLEVVPAPVHVSTSAPHGFAYYLPSSLALLKSTEALYELLGDAMRGLLAATHLRRHGG
ncbi:MAG: YdcF family protein [Steroidobacteraceae bacterium]